MNLLIVESPAKAKTLAKYLGGDFEVISSYGHIRSLPSASGSVEPEKSFEMHYEVPEKSVARVSTIMKSVKEAKNIFLATDPDREGEAISWHILELSKIKKAIKPGTNIKRVVFHEITKKAVLDAIANPRDINMDLVNAQQARLALDYLVGFTLSPVLWRKLPGSRSAGRVQSVALRLIVEREHEIARFNIEEYWGIVAHFQSGIGSIFPASLIKHNKEKLEKFSIRDKKSADAIVEALKGLQYSITDIEKKKVMRHPSPPFTTSTLIQEAARKLGFSAKKTSQVAQKLYEGVSIGGELKGLITYMRTDSLNLSEEAISSIRSQIKADFGPSYLPQSPKVYKTKSKNAQEAHEAIRPTNIMLKPSDIKRDLSIEQYELYELIWRRAISCQMSSAELEATSVMIEDESRNSAFRASGSVVVFDGFLRVYKEGEDDCDEEKEGKLPKLALNDSLIVNDISGEQHFTQPPPRYTEASLVKKLEELGIGRPSTYQSIISILQERKYITLDKKRFIPEFRGMVVSEFLVLCFQKYVEYDFTAHMEDGLDDVASGQKQWKEILQDFWMPFKQRTDEVLQYKNQDILVNIEEKLHDFLFPEAENAEVKCPKCGSGALHLRLGSFGAFIGCSKYPECDYIKNIPGVGDAEQSAIPDQIVQKNDPRTIGIDPDTGKDISVKKGPYGFYLQIGEDSLKKRVSLPAMFPPDKVTLDQALFLFSLPKSIGIHPETNEQIKLGIGKFGPYLQIDKKYISVRNENLMGLDLNKALVIIAKHATNKTVVKRGTKKSKR